ncbi:hypothetical protein COLO4_36327 [Corchorus olitorius]|uniref:Uncharacterized protein n=1 Tax=Corchorus olitorius TaxID=93759 RepID=A0A1R3G9T5_9ROSI|nr:hypothetical protein COLO4_36327 [Corchorus olitorius]
MTSFFFLQPRSLPSALAAPLHLSPQSTVGVPQKSRQKPLFTFLRPNLHQPSRSTLPESEELTFDLAKPTIR